MNVLSLFDGMSCGRVALERVGIKVDNYFSSEIDKYAIQIANKNYPQDEVNRLGDVTKWQDWNIDWSSIDLVTGGFPCQAWSIAGKQLGDKDERGMLFWTMLDIMKKVLEYNPRAKFLIENVRMKKEFEEYITLHTSNALGVVHKHLINSALVSAQNRQRYYWTNIENIEQLKDKGLLLRDILETNVEDKFTCSEAQTNKMIRHNNKITKTNENPDKSACIHAGYFKGGGRDQQYVILENIKPSVAKNILEQEEFIQEGKNGFYQLKCKGGFQDNKIGVTKTPTLRAGNSSTYIKAGDFHYRKLTPLECERLQTLPDNYTEGVSNTQRYKMIGNGWTVDVIAHIFRRLNDKY